VITATFNAAPLTAASPESGARTIAGVAVPWGVVGRVSDGREVIFEPGSLDETRRPPALRDHDRTRPIGMVTGATDNGAGLDATVRASRTRDGDDALVLAADGALGMFSVGVEPTDWFLDDAGVMHVTAGDWQELSLLTFGAYAGARVSTVTATQPEGAAMLDTDTPTEPDVEQPDDEQPDEEQPTAPDGEQLVLVEAARSLPVLAGTPRAARVTAAPARHPYAGVGIGQMAGLVMAARSGDMRANQLVGRITSSPGAYIAPINAALSDVTLVGTDNVGAGFRPAYQAELIEVVSYGSPVVEALRQGDLQRGDYPNKTFNQWTKTPQVALQTAEKAAINSTPVSIGTVSTPVKTWATGNDLSQQLLDFGSPSFVEDYIRQAGVDYAEVIEAYAVAGLLAIATPATTAIGASFVDIIGALFGVLDPTKVPPGGFFLAVSWDLWVSLVGVTQDEAPAFWQGNISFGSMLPSTSMGGLSIIVSMALPSATALLGLRNAATWYDLPGTPFSLRAINVGQLGLDVGVYGYGALGIQFPFAFAKTTVPVGP
jgi:hypothetical protein